MAWSYHFYNKLCSVQIKKPFLAVTKALYQHVQMLAGVPSPRWTRRSGRCTSSETTTTKTRILYETGIHKRADRERDLYFKELINP